MRFSVLLPTKNRLDLLRYAVDTVRRQSYADVEIVISDNCSEDDIAGFAASLGDPRVKYVRSPKPIPVTENWNLALEHSTGDYVVMLGDDDGLLKGYLETAAALIEQHGRPDLVLTDALLYAYPGVMPGHPKGFLQVGYGRFFEGVKEPYLLDRGVAREAVDAALDFRLTFQFNMQYSIVSRRLVERLREHGPYFQSPYPDFYASNANLLLAERILVVPRPMVCIGISPKSFGWYYYNQRQEEGAQFLANMMPGEIWERLRGTLLPGNDLMSCWLAAVDTVRENLRRAPVDGRPLEVGTQRYRFLQLWHAANHLPRRQLFAVFGAARWWEWVVFGPVAALLVFARRNPASGWLQALKRAIDRRMSPLPDRDTRVKEIPARNMTEVFDSVAPEYY